MAGSSGIFPQQGLGVSKNWGRPRCWVLRHVSMADVARLASGGHLQDPGIGSWVR